MLSFLLWVVVITIIKIFKDNDFKTSKAVHSTDHPLCREGPAILIKVWYKRKIINDVADL